MRSISDVRLEEFENVAMESVKKLSEYFKYEGADPRYFQKARVASGMISAYARLRASETNRQAIALDADLQSFLSDYLKRPKAEAAPVTQGPEEVIDSGPARHFDDFKDDIPF